MSRKADVVDYDKRISKKLSYLLRHAAVKKGFNIRPDGFIPVQEILKETPGCTVKDIERIVAKNEKQRFTLSNFNNVLMIKANQGHTISQVDSLNLKLLDSVDFDIVHGTYHSCYEKIRHQGLSRMKRNHIHFAKGLNFINGLRRNAELFIFINYPKAKGDGLKFYESENNVILCPGNSEGFIETKYFSKVVTRSGIVLLNRTMEIWCDVCKMTLQDDYAFQGHIMGKKHLKNKEYIKNNTIVAKRSVFVSHIPAEVPSKTILNFFSQYGKIAYFSFKKNYLILEFENENPANVLLEKPVYFSGTRLNILPRTMHDIKPPLRENKSKDEEAINDTVDLNYENLKSIFEVESTFDEQLAVFLDKVAIKKSDIIWRYEPTCEKLNEIFRTIFPKCKTYRFGSTVSGLGFKNCDLDIYIDPGFPVCQENDSKLSPNVVTTSAIFTDVKRILYARTYTFSKVVPIPKAKTPIIKFFYIPSKTSCDISFKNSLAVHNSLLVKHCLSLDPRLRPAMMVIKYWVSNFELKGGDKMSKYSLTLLFLFYLQQESVKLVPPLIELKRRVVPQIIEGWQVNFDNSKSANNEDHEGAGNSKSIPELLHGFFDFYARYEFKDNVVCPIDGQSHKKESFNDVDNIPESMDRYREYLKTKENPVPFPINKTMCVQDPNELSHNVTGNICPKHLEKFQAYCGAAAVMCAAAAEKHYKDLLPSIFSLAIKPPAEEAEVSFLYYAKNYLNVGLPEDFESNTKIADKTLFINENWYNLITYLTQKFLEGILRLEVQVISDEQEQKQQKVEERSDVHSNSQDQILMRCTGKYCLWKDRKNKLNILDPSIDLLEKEIQLTQQMYKELSENNTLQKMKIDFNFRIWKKGDKNVHVIVTLSNNYSAKKTFSHLAAYIKDKLPEVLSKTLAHMQQFKKTPITEPLTKPIAD